MRTSKTRARKFSSTVGKIVMAFVFASMIGGISIAPAFGKDKDNDRHEGYQEHGRYEHDRREYQPPRRYYSAPVYAPPPFIYFPTPYQSPGISLFFPIYIR
jgi:hypothetical protein